MILATKRNWLLKISYLKFDYQNELVSKLVFNQLMINLVSNYNYLFIIIYFNNQFLII